MCRSRMGLTIQFREQYRTVWVYKTATFSTGFWKTKNERKFNRYISFCTKSNIISTCWWFSWKLFMQQFSVELSSLRPIQHSLQICVQVGGSAHTTNVIQRIHNNLILSKGFRISSIVLVIWITIETNWLDFINYYCSSVFSPHFIETTKCWPFSIFNWYNMCVNSSSGYHRLPTIQFERKCWILNTLKRL